MAVSGCRSRLCGIIAFLLFVAATPSDGSELNIEAWHWNLDNTAVQGQFNTLLLVVSNVTDKPFEGVLSVKRGTGIAVDDVVTQEVYLSPGVRNMKFYFDVFVEDGIDEYVARWAVSPRYLGRNIKQSLLLNTAPLRPAIKGGGNTESNVDQMAVVALDDGGLRLPRAAGIARIADSWFPPSAATLPAGGVVLTDHAPRFQSAQVQALVDWIKLGGVLRIYARADAPVELGGDLASIVSPQADEPDGQRLGAGIIIRRPENLADVPAETLRALKTPADERLDDDAAPTSTNSYYNNYYLPNTNPSSSFFDGLGYLHRPDVNWWVVFVLFGVYVVVLVCGGLLVSRRTRSWQKTYLSLLGTVAVFSVVFWQLGARGHGEQTTVSTVAVADVLDADRARIHGWTDLFTTKSETYELRPGRGRGGLRPRERSGLLRGGPEPLLIRSAPSFSSITFEWQAITEAKPPRLVDAKLNGQYLQFRVVFPEIERGPVSSPKSDPYDMSTAESKVLFVRNGELGRGSRSLVNDGDQVSIDLRNATPMRLDTIGLNQQFEWGGGYGYRRRNDGSRSELLNFSFDDLALVASIGVLRRPTIGDRVDVLIFDRIGNPIAPGVTAETGRDEGRILWRIPIWIDGETVSGPLITALGETPPEATDETGEQEAPPELDDIFDPA